MSTLDHPTTDSLTFQRKFNLTLKEPPMTIIAAMRESADSALIATDSMQTETGGIRSFTDQKLQHHPLGAPLAWGTSGNATIGEDFNEWAKDLNWPPKNWNQLRQQIARRLADLNGEQRRLCKMAEVEPKDNDLTSVLVVAYVDKIRLLEVDHCGVVTEHKRELHAIGTGWPHAHVVHQTLAAIRHAFKDTVPPEQELRLIVDLAARSAEHCYPPVVLGRVTSTGFHRIELTP